MNLLRYVPLIAKAVAGVNVKDEMDKRVDVINRPWWMSGRFIGVAMTTVFGGYAATAGVDLNASIDSITKLASFLYENKEPLVVIVGLVGGVLRGLLGIIQRKK